MRVWHLSSNRWNSAITEYALSAARALAGRGHETMFLPLAGSPAEERAKGYQLPTTPLPSFGLGALGGLKRLAAKDPPDWVVAYGGPETLLAKWLPGRKARFRGQVVPRGLFPDLKHKIGLAGIDRVLAPSAGIVQGLTGLVADAKLSVVTLGIDTGTYHRTRAASAPRPELVVLGRLDPVKGHAALLDLMGHVWQGWDGPGRPLLHIVGEPANLSEAELRALVAAKKRQDDVRLTVARVADVAGLMSSAALGVVPSLGSEIICRVAEEFLLCGTPIVVSGAGSLNEVLFEGAGASYAGCSADETAGILRKWAMRGATEGEGKKEARAATAKGLFSLEAMGLALEGALR